MIKFKYRNFIISLFVSLFFGILVQAKVYAFQITDNQTVDANKTWTIKFTSNVGFDTLTRQGITVTDSKGNKVDVIIQLGDDDNTVIVTAPQGGYTAGESYILDIGTKTHSSKGTSLKREYKVHFNIKDDNSIVTFKDDNLEKVVRNAINKPTGDIYKNDVQNITSLDTSNKGIKDISGIENLGNLQTLCLDHNQISDIIPLQRLINLQHLELEYNQISNIDALSGLIKLQNLYLEDNQISDISPLQGLTNLQTLFLKDNQISNISALSSLTNLQYLYLSGNQITDYSPVKGYYNNLTDKDFEISDSNNTVVTFKDKNLEQLIRIIIHKPTGDIYKSDIKNITYLDASNKGIQDINGIENLTNLQTLDLKSNQINNISALKELANLQYLDLCSNQISDISVLNGLTNIQNLDLSINQISNISLLSGLAKLQTLFLYGNKISNTDEQSLKNALPKCNITF